jgi:hypothetical protein
VIRKDLWSDAVWAGNFRPPAAAAAATTAYSPNQTFAAAAGTNLPGHSAVVRELAFARESLQSSLNYGGVSSRAVDGNPNAYYANGSCTHTQEQPNPWWQARCSTKSLNHSDAHQ